MAQTLKLGLVTFTAHPSGPFMRVSIGGEGYLTMAVAEWSSLNAINDVLAAADVVHVRLRAALKEAIEIAIDLDEGREPDVELTRRGRLAQLKDFLDGKRPGL